MNCLFFGKSYDEKAQKVNLLITDISGKVVKEIKVEQRKGQNRQAIEVDDLGSGVYIINVEGQFTSRFVRL